MFVGRDNSGGGDGMPFGIGRPEQADPATDHGWLRGRSSTSATPDANRSNLNASDLADLANSIQQLVLELQTIERERREGRLDSLELIDRYLTVWFAIKEIDCKIEAAESQD